MADCLSSSWPCRPDPTGRTSLEHQNFLNIKLLKPAPLSPAAAMLLLPAGGLRRAEEAAPG